LLNVALLKSVPFGVGSLLWAAELTRYAIAFWLCLHWRGESAQIGCPIFSIPILLGSLSCTARRRIVFAQIAAMIGGGHENGEWSVVTS